MGFLGLVDTDGAEEVVEVEEVKQVSRIERMREERNGVSVIDRTTPSSVTTSHTTMASAPAQSAYHIISLQPRSYSEARQVGEAFRDGNPVIINLDDMEEAERKRLVDFASGLVFGHFGRIERVSSKVFLLSPANVNVSNEDRTSAQAQFFNQS